MFRNGEGADEQKPCGNSPFKVQLMELLRAGKPMQRR